MEGIYKPIIDIIQQVGFPAAVALWLLWRTDKRLEHMAEILASIAVTMGKIETELRDTPNE